MTAAEKWVKHLWKAVEEHARPVDGNKVVALLREASDEVWQAGLDARFARYAEPTDEYAAAFDISWLSILLSKLLNVSDRRAG